MLALFRAILLLALLLPGAAFAHEYKVGDLVIVHPWARATAAGQDVAGGFVTITNKASAPDRLLAVETASAAQVQIHEMSMTGGVMKMRELAEGLEIKPGETVVLKPKSLHLMFMGLVSPLDENSMFDAVLVFEKAGRVPVEFMVEAMGGEGKHH